MVGIINGKVKKVPLGDVAGKLKMVSPDDQLIKKQNASASALVYKTETVSDGSHFTSDVRAESLPQTFLKYLETEGKHELYCFIP